MMMLHACAFKYTTGGMADRKILAHNLVHEPGSQFQRTAEQILLPFRLEEKSI